MVDGQVKQEENDDMGMRPEAIVAFGVDLGNPEDEWHFDLGDGCTLPEPWSDEQPDWDELIAEFAGWDEPDLPWGERGSVEYEARTVQYRRELALRKSTEIESGCYGYEWNGQCLYVAGSKQSVDWGCVPLKPLLRPKCLAIEQFEEFVRFLDGRGLRLKPEHRAPDWLLMSSYG